MADEAPQDNKPKISLPWPLSVIEPLAGPITQRLKTWDDFKLGMVTILAVILWAAIVYAPAVTKQLLEGIQSNYQKFATDIREVASAFDKQQERTSSEHKAEQDRTYKLIEKMQDRQMEMMYGIPPVAPKERPANPRTP